MLRVKPSCMFESFTPTQFRPELTLRSGASVGVIWRLVTPRSGGWSLRTPRAGRPRPAKNRDLDPGSGGARARRPPTGAQKTTRPQRRCESRSHREAAAHTGQRKEGRATGPPFACEIDQPQGTGGVGNLRIHPPFILHSEQFGSTVQNYTVQESSNISTPARVYGDTPQRLGGSTQSSTVDPSPMRPNQVA